MYKDGVQCVACTLAENLDCPHYSAEYYEGQGWVVIDPAVIREGGALVMKRVGEQVIEYLFVSRDLPNPVIVSAPRGAVLKF